MKRASLLFSLLLASILPSSAADRLEQWYNLMPKDTVGVIAIKNTPELPADWDKSSYAKFMQDDEAKRWLTPMRKAGEAPWDKFFKDTYGLSLIHISRDPANAMMGTIIRKRPMSMAMPSVVLYQGVLAVRPAKALPLFPVAEL